MDEKNRVAAGTLMVSDEQADRWVLCKTSFTIITVVIPCARYIIELTACIMSIRLNSFVIILCLGCDSYCLTNGDYVVALEDHTLFRESGQHAKVVFEAQGQAPITLLGTQNQYFRVGLGPNKPQEHALAYSMGGVVALAAVVLLLIMKWCVVGYQYFYVLNCVF